MASISVPKGFRLTHVGLRVADLDRSIAFYSGVFGMSELYRMPLDTVTVVFLAYADSAAPDTPLFAREGVLELVCPKDQTKAAADCDTSFVKLAFGTPDLAKTVEHLNAHDVKIVKHSGTAHGSEVPARFLGCALPDSGLHRELWDAMVNVPFVEDPDGYLIEIIPYSNGREE
ncbi:glyoxalase family protein [Paraphoma chrysanthemicola]|uniref:Glyoxalase family protein n=1 Tax=Paraphoma chrysanthemicola TaxID=798071 RepID=A0A8K0R646_9PLEO|nr:glyoxalase family protein [Paraphoma chrysanthemicola]